MPHYANKCQQKYSIGKSSLLLLVNPPLLIIIDSPFLRFAASRALTAFVATHLGCLEDLHVNRALRCPPTSLQHTRFERDQHPSPSPAHETLQHFMRTRLTQEANRQSNLQSNALHFFEALLRLETTAALPDDEPLRQGGNHNHRMFLSEASQTLRLSRMHPRHPLQSYQPLVTTDLFVDVSPAFLIYNLDGSGSLMGARFWQMEAVAFHSFS